MAATGPIPTISESLARGIQLAFPQQGGGRAEEFTAVLNRALEIASIDPENAIFSQETLQLGVGGTTASLSGAGTELLGDSNVVVAFMRVAADTANLEFKAPTGFTGIWDINADSTLLMSANLTVSGVSAINQDVTSGADSTFGNLTITSFAADWTNAGRTIADLGTVTTVDMNGGTVDGTIIGGSVAGAGTFTNLIGGTDLALASGATVTAILDEDNMASNSATALVTQQSLVAFVASQIGSNNELSEILTNGNTTGANDLIVTIGQKIDVDKIEQTVAGGLQIDLTTADTIAITTDDGAFGESGYNADTTFSSLFTDGFNAFMQVTDDGSDTNAEISLQGAKANVVAIGSGNVNGGEILGRQLLAVNNETGNIQSADSDINGTLISTRSSTMNSGVTNSCIFGGTGIVASADDTVYVPDLVIQSGKALFVGANQVLSAQASAEADPATITNYAAHASGAVTVTSNAATDLDTASTISRRNYHFYSSETITVCRFCLCSRVGYNCIISI